jgi:glycerol-3-phosphate dehydrogenase (NAD(P)+)
MSARAPDVRVAVVGAGAWGTALACAARRAGNETTLLARDSGVVNAVNADRVNPNYLPGARLPEGIVATGDPGRALAGAQFVLLAVPAQAIGDIALGLAGVVARGTVLVGCAKGIDRKNGRLPHQNLAAALPGHVVAALSGPSFAGDVVTGLPTALTVACGDLATAARLARLLSSPAFRCYASDDLAGVELGGALKNVLAIAVGAARGMRLGASAEAALIARGFAEMSRLAVARGARGATLAGLSGLGDLVLTCSSPQSRNFAYGTALGQGRPLDGLPLAEGAFTAAIAASIAAEAGVEAPIIGAVAAVLERRITPREAVAALLERPLKSETQ